MSQASTFLATLAIMGLGGVLSAWFTGSPGAFWVFVAGTFVGNCLQFEEGD